MTLTLHGIRNCDTMKKARAWLDAHGVDYQFHDYKTQGIDAGSLRRWVAALGEARVLNRAGTTFRKLPDDVQAGLTTDSAITLMVEQPSMIRRPLLEGEWQGRPVLAAGFKPEDYAALLKS